MTTKAENELLTRVGRGTPMGEMLRRYWIPFLTDGNLERDGQPMRVRLLGEDLLAFRDSAGRVGLLDPYCAHRRASLYFGRNEECGLRCVYHGWKFDVDGNCVDTPNAASDQLKTRVRQPSYPVVERNGVLWAYMGRGEAPQLPDLEFNLVPRDQVYLSIRVQECNWLQALEGSIDSSHGQFLHSRVDGYKRENFLDIGDRAPHFEVIDKEWGVTIGARRSVGDDEYHWRVNLFAFPFFTLVPPFKKDPFLNGQAWVPLDDEHCLMFHFTWHPTTPLPDSLLALHRNGRRDGSESGHVSQRALLGAEERDMTRPYARFWTRYNRSNDYGLDIELQRTKYYSGVMPVWPQDAAVQESMGPIVDRSLETLCTSDIGIARTRRALAAACRRFNDEGQSPPGIEDPSIFRVRPVGALSTDSTLEPFLKGKLDAIGDLGYEPF